MSRTETPSKEAQQDLDYLLTAYLFDSLSPLGRQEVETRLEIDPGARAELDALRGTLELVEESLPDAGDEREGAYCFEQKRLERVLAASKKQPAVQITTRRLSLALAALVIGFAGLSSMYLLLMGGASAPVEKMASSHRLDEFSERRTGGAAPAAAENIEPAAATQASSSRKRESSLKRTQIIGVGGGAAGAYGFRAGKARVITEREGEESSDEKFLAENNLNGLIRKKRTDGIMFSKIVDEKKADRLRESIEKLDPGKTERLKKILAKQTRDFSGRKRSLQAAKVPAKRVPEKAAENKSKPAPEALRKNIPAPPRRGETSRNRVVDPIGVAGVPPMDKNATADKQIRRKIAEPAIREIQSLDGIELGNSEFEKEIRPPATPGAPGNRIADSDRSKDKNIFFNDDSFDAELIEENTEGDVGFTDADFSFDEEADEESEDVVNQIAGEKGQSPRGPAQSFEGASENYRLNISRQNGRFLPLGNDAGRPARAQQGQQLQKAQTAVEEVQEEETGFVFSDLGQEQEEDLLVVNEATLNTFSFYRNLDSRLSFQQFRSKALTIPAPSIGDEGLGEKGFRKKYGVNPFVSTSRDHLSTFGMDVDNAAWGRTREILRSGELPQNEVVRVEEFVNNFSDERTGNPQSVFTVYTEGGPSPFGDRELELLQVTIKSRNLLPGERKNAVLTFAVDTSGSMAATGKLELLKESLKTLVSNLGSNDRVAIVAFSTHAYVVLPHTSVRHRTHIMDAINSLSPDGGTNVEAGIDLAYRLAGESHDRKAANRVILCSDGVANLGSKGPEAILKRIQRFARDNMISLFTFAFGSGGRQAVQGDKMLQRLANEGDGKYQYVDTRESARDLFSLPEQLQFLASDAKIQVNFNPEAISHYRLLGYEKRDIADVDFRNDRIDAGEVGPGSTVTAIYEIKRAHPSGSLGRIHLRYRDEASRRFEEVDFELPTGVLAATIADTTDRFRFIASVAEFAEILRGSYYARNGSYGSILQLLDSNSGPWRSRLDWKEAHQLISIAQGLSAVKHLQTLEGQEHLGN